MLLKSYKELIVWNKSVDMSVLIYRVTASFPDKEMYGITNQIRRCAVSIPSNIAEGHSRGSRKEYVQFLRIAFGSGAELETQLLIAKKVGYLSDRKFLELSGILEEVMRMLNKLIAKLKPRP